ncbi:MAG: methyltransferase domain-containing protein [Silicimonas sp.]|nr:methyltransferase domain-containing protein [Silicimonas sp.]
MGKSPFFDLYETVPRQGPGDRATLDFALRIVGVGGDAQMLDAGCGVGADVEALLEWAPKGHVTAIDAHAPFVAQITARYKADDRVTAIVGDMAAQSGPFDLILCAGALYFLGLDDGLSTFKRMLAPGGALIFSHPAFFTEPPSQEAQAFWEGERDVEHTAHICEAVRAAGLDILDATVLPDAAWEAFYTPLQARIEERLSSATGEMKAVLIAAQREIDAWRSVKAETGYIQIVAVTP